jgi:hypothetical protein
MLWPTAVGFEEGTRNPEGERVLEFAVANNLVVDLSATLVTSRDLLIL